MAMILALLTVSSAFAFEPMTWGKLLLALALCTSITDERDNLKAASASRQAISYLRFIATT